MLRAAAGAAGVLCLVGCGGTIAIPFHSSSGPPSASYPAAGMRAHVTLLYGERTYVLGKLAAAAVAGKKDEFAAYSGMLATNGDDLAAAVSKAAGESEGASFHQAVVLGDSFYVDYIVAATTQQQDVSDAAMQNLTTRYAPEMAQVLSSTLNISTGTADKLLGDEVNSIKHFVDDAATSSFYSDLRDAYSKAIAMGGSAAEGIALKFPDKYPGDVAGPGAKLRAQLDATLQEHSLLMTLVTSQIGAKGGASSLQANTDELARIIGSAFGAGAADQSAKAWADEDDGMLAYASAPDDTTRQSAVDNLHQNVTPELASLLSRLNVTGDAAGEIAAAIQVIDDQRTKAYDRIAADDRSAAAQVIALGDAVLGAPQG